MRISVDHMGHAAHILMSKRLLREWQWSIERKTDDVGDEYDAVQRNARPTFVDLCQDRCSRARGGSKVSSLSDRVRSSRYDYETRSRSWLTTVIGSSSPRVLADSVFIDHGHTLATNHRAKSQSLPRIATSMVMRLFSCWMLCFGGAGMVRSGRRYSQQIGLVFETADQVFR